ncbi:hypothetical protein CH371_06655 [Leptospira wolffii]|uniref:Uncharacterized protein n=1 Tax=Leptospira wolffii TaxID=409998 RepID=A0A2M9ZH67_9LEPT|nr:hypothetical protein CH371_06655 [Leptospira wolffii]
MSKDCLTQGFTRIHPVRANRIFWKFLAFCNKCDPILEKGKEYYNIRNFRIFLKLFSCSVVYEPVILP